MSDMHLRTKLRKVMEAAKNTEHISERSKTIGLLVFFIFVAIGIIGFTAFLVALFIHGHRISALILFIFLAFILYAAYKIITANDMPEL